MSELLWFLTRSSGIVALVLMVAAVANGLLFSARATGRRRRPAWWLDLHRELGGLALVFTGLHVATALGADVGVGLADALVPQASSTAAVTLGVVALYGLALTVLTSWPARRLRRPVWHTVHVLSIPAAVAAGVHGYQLGTDAHTGVYTVVLLAAMAVGAYGLGRRLARRRTRRPAHHPTPTPVATPERELLGAGR